MLVLRAVVVLRAAWAACTRVDRILVKEGVAKAAPSLFLSPPSGVVNLCAPLHYLAPMTNSEIPWRGDRWLRAVGYGLLAEVLTVLTIIAIVMAYRYRFARGLSGADYAAFGVRTGKTMGIAGGTLFTFFSARLLMPRLTRRFVEHGLVVAAAAVAFSIGGSIAGHNGVPAGYALASVLKLAAGALAGFLYSRSTVATIRRLSSHSRSPINE